jgi:hypothetical protein
MIPAYRNRPAASRTPTWLSLAIIGAVSAVVVQLAASRLVAPAFVRWLGEAWRIG